MLPAVIAYLADDHRIVAEGVAALLKSSGCFTEVVVFSNGKLLYQACNGRLPDFVFLDYQMADWDGLKTLQELKRAWPQLPVLMLSMNNERSIVENCIQQGAAGYLSKESRVEELQEAVQAVKDNEIYYSKSVLKVLAGVRQATNMLAAPAVQLSQREAEILRHICEGDSPKEIAARLFLSVRTVETHKSNIMQKLGVNSVTRLISFAIKNNLVS